MELATQNSNSDKSAQYSLDLTKYKFSLSI